MNFTESTFCLVSAARDWKKKQESRFNFHWVSTSAKFRTPEQNIAFDPRLKRGTNN